MFFSIDLGPVARKYAEQRGTDYLKRPLHIGRLGAFVWPGRFELNDVVIEGVSKTDQPFLSARKIFVNLTWRTLITRELFLDVEMADWKMAIETWPNRPSSLPKIMPEGKSDKPLPFTTTVRVWARRGQFTYLDHGAPWSVVAPNLSFDLVRAENLHAYVGTAHFDRGVVQIQQYLPMAASMTTRFTLGEHGHVQLHHIDLITDGARSSITGEVFLGERWPEQTYHVDSRLSFSRMRELFFTNEPWRVAGDGRFVGTFRISKAIPHDLRGRFTSDLATLDTPGTRLVFPRLQGSLAWLPNRFAVTDASADFYGGRANFDYSLAPLGTPRPATARFSTQYEGVDLQTFSHGIQFGGLDLRGRASGQNEMSWQNGRLRATLAGSGRMTAAPPAGQRMASAALEPGESAPPPEPAPFQKDRPLGPLPVSGEVAYRFDPDGLDLDPSWVASSQTYVSFQGRADYGARSNLPFHVTSHNWQESDRILAAILTSAGAPTGAVEAGGFGQFDGVMTRSFSQPRIEGRFAGDATRSWGVTWGRAVGDLVIENQFITIRNAVISRPSGERMTADGRFSLGFRRPAEAAEELKDVRVVVTHWPLVDFREAFSLNGWPVTGTVEAADLRLSGAYHGPVGPGVLRIERGTAWDETFDRVSGDLAFTGTGLEVSHIVMAKDVGQVTGSALLKWDGTYAFDARGEKIPVESLTSFTVPKAPLSGVLGFTGSGEGELDNPRYAVRWSVPDLSAGSQGIGAVSATMEVRNRTLNLQQLEAHSVLLQVFGNGSIALNEAYDATLNFRFTNSRLDPYLPLIAPRLASQLSQYLRAVVGGTVQVQGELKNHSALGVYAAIESVDLKVGQVEAPDRRELVAYRLINDGTARLSFENDVGAIRNLRLVDIDPSETIVGANTRLTIEGNIPRSDAPMQLSASGTANLAILQLVFDPATLTASGALTLNADFTGSLEALNVSGRANITAGRLRYRTFPHGLEQINGPITFDANRINVDELRARMAEGEVTFAGSVDLKGLVPDQFNVRAEGRSMGLRFPAGFRSTVNASLALTGPVSAPTLSGDVIVLRSIYLQEIPNDQAVVAVMALGGPGAEAGPAPVTEEDTSPMKLNVTIRAPSSAVRIDTTEAQIYGLANLTVRGTISQPVVSGLVTLERGNAYFNGNRYTFQPSSIEFLTGTRVRPFFDVSFATRVRVPAQAYDITIHITGEPTKLDLALNADPYLPSTDIINLLFGERSRDPLRDVELRSAVAPQIAEQQAVRNFAAQLLTMPISSRIGSVVQRTIPCDTFSIVPILGDQLTFQSLTPTARVTCGKRISERMFLTYSRALNATRQYDIMLLEYEQSDRVSWVLSRNEDRTFALDFRIRHVF